MKDLPINSIPVLLDSLSISTKKQYNSAFRQWWTYCTKEEVDPFKATINEVISFFQDLYENQPFKYGTFNNVRSALALILPEGLGNNIYIKRYLKGISKLRPPRPKFNMTWDPKILLNYLEQLYPNEEISLEMLTKKLVTLLSLITAQRFQTLSLIRVENIIFTADGNVQIFIVDNIKTSAPGRHQPFLQFPFFLQKPEICVAQTLHTYIERTSNIREDQTFLFLTFTRPHRRATSQTLSRWVKEILNKAGINTNMFTAYSVRHASTSCAYRSGVSIEVIRKMAGWTNKSETFLKFYNKPLSSPVTQFTKTILETK